MKTFEYFLSSIERATKHYCAFVFLSFLVLDIGCAQAGAQSCSTNGTTRTCTPTRITDAFRNPDTGWVVYEFVPACNATPSFPCTNSDIGTTFDTPLADTVYTNYFSWGDLEPYQGTYSWWRVDQLINAYINANPGRHFKFGIVLLDPTSRPWNGALGYGQTPTWLINILCPTDPTVCTATGDEGRWATSIEGITAQYGSNPAHAVFEPYYWTNDFLQAHHTFINDLIHRYFNNDPVTAGYSGAPDWSSYVTGIEMATYGAWGEWHSDIAWPDAPTQYQTLQTMQNDYFSAIHANYISGKPQPRLEQSTIGSTLGGAYTITADATHPSTYLTDLSSVYYALQPQSFTSPTLTVPGASMVRKFLGADPSFFYHQDEQQVVNNNLLNAPFRLEWGSCTGALTQQAFGCLGGSPDTLEGAIDRALLYQASNVGWYDGTYLNTDPNNNPIYHSQTTEYLDKYFQSGTTPPAGFNSKPAGYRFVVQQFQYPVTVTHNHNFQVISQWHNEGVAKNYRHYSVRAYLRNGGGVETPLAVSNTFASDTWGLGPSDPVHQVTSTFLVPANQAAGSYTLKFAVVDASGNPAMNLAISGKDIADLNAYSKYVVGPITVR